MNAVNRRPGQADKPGRLELAIVEWQRQLVRKREAEIAGRLEPCSSNADSGNAGVLQDHSATA